MRHGLIGWVCIATVAASHLAGCGSDASGGARDERARGSDDGEAAYDHGGSGAPLYPGPSGSGGTSARAPVVGQADGGPAFPEAPAAPPVANPFTMTAHDPLSTFAADVDTASYDLFRRDIGYDHLPLPETVRTEEWVNFFRYSYEAPAADAPDPFAISLAAAPTVFGDGTTTLRVGIQGKLPTPFEKKPTNLVFLVDVSGSMQTAEKLPLAKHLIKQSLLMLAATDEVSIVKYADGVGVVLRPTPAGDRSTVEAAVDALVSGGGTNGAGGIQLAYEQATAGFIEGGINHVVLCTDGDFNIGVSNTAELVSLITEKRKTGITLTALGFGAGAINDAMMEAVSNAGNGTYSVIASESQADRYAEERLLATINHIAKDMKIQVEFNPAEVVAYRLLGYEDRAIADDDFRNDVVDAGEVGAGHRVTALYQLVLAGGEVPVTNGAPSVADGAAFDGTPEVAAGDLVLVKVRYKQPGASESDPASEVAVSLAGSAVADDLTGADADLQWAAAVSGLAEILRGSPYARRESIGTLRALVTANASQDADRTEFEGLFEKAATLLATP